MMPANRTPAGADSLEGSSTALWRPLEQGDAPDALMAAALAALSICCCCCWRSITRTPPPPRPPPRATPAELWGDMLLDGMTPPTQHPAPRPPSLAGSEAGMLEGCKPKGGDEKLGLYRGRLEEDECPLCLEPYSGDNPKVVLSCGHVYHLPCVLQWRERADRCPVCARPIAFVGGNVYDDGPDAGADDAAAS